MIDQETYRRLRETRYELIRQATLEGREAFLAVEKAKRELQDAEFRLRQARERIREMGY